MLDLGGFLLFIFFLRLIFRTRNRVVSPPRQAEPKPDYSKNSAYYLKEYPELLKVDKIPGPVEPTEIPPNIIFNITNNHHHNHLHVHLNGEEEPDERI